VHFFWLLFFVQAKKSDPRAGCARKGEWTRLQEQNKIKMDSGLRRNDEQEQNRWIPAKSMRE